MSTSSDENTNAGSEESVSDSEVKRPENTDAETVAETVAADTEGGLVQGAVAGSLAGGGDGVGGDETGGDETGGDETGGDETGGDETGGDETGADLGVGDLADSDFDDPDLDGDYEEDEFEGEADPIEDVAEEAVEDVEKKWYILKVQVNREKSICDALARRVKMHGLESHFGDILVPTEDVKEFTKTGKQRVVKKKLYPGYIVVNMAINDDTWFIVRETPGIGDFTGSVGKPAPIDGAEVEKILKLSRPVVSEDEGKQAIRNTFPYKVGDQVRVNEGNFQSLEGGVETIDESNGRITVMLNMFGRPTPVQLDHWQVEKV